MEGKTHKLGGTVCSLAGFIVLKESGYLFTSDVVSPALQFVLIYGSGIYGGVWSDNDHHWASSPLNDPASWVQNKVLHTFNKSYHILDHRLNAKEKRFSLQYKLVKFLACKHRSWQTHSEFTLLMLYLFWNWNINAVQSEVSLVLNVLLTLGFSMGVVSHIFLDMLTTEGVPLMISEFCRVFFPNIRLPQSIRLVPPTSAFKTGSEWEMSIRKGLKIVQYLLILAVVPYLFGFSVPKLILSLLT